MERRAFIAIILSLGVLFAYQAFMPKQPPKPAVAATQGADPAVVTAPNVPSTVVSSVVSTAPVEPGAVGAPAESDTRIETSNVIAIFTNRGGRLKSWQLKHYKDSKGEPLELVAADLASTQPLPFTLRAADDQTTATLNGALYAVRGAPDASAPIRSATTVTFEYVGADLSATKTFTLQPDGYTVSLKTDVVRAGTGQSVAVLWGPGLGDSDAQSGRSGVKPGGLYSSGGKVSRLTASSITKQPFYQQPFDYVGMDDHYFTSFVLKPGTATVQYSNLSIPPAAGTKDPARDLVAYAVTPSSADQVLTYYVGPKDFDTLASIDRTLTKAINFGMFSVIVVPLLRSLQWIHGYVGNYGWAITLLTILINLVLFPLNHKSVVSMRKMQEVQPEAKAIQERYAKLKATDPARQKMNQELMALYKLRGVNPASGCVPILLTLPVFLAFYSMLQTAIELRGAPFIGWIHDLSLPDAYYVLPVLVAASQFITQWMTPQTGMDPAQAKMMLFMPLVLGFVFISTPAGALIYWLVSGVWRIGQMQLTNYMIGPPKIRGSSSGGSGGGSAAERRVKRVGQGKTDAAAREE